MAKRKAQRAQPVPATAMHTATSESVKIRPRKQLKTSVTTTTTSTTRTTKIPKVEDDADSSVLRPMPLANLDELFAIWAKDMRIPTVESRRKWAAARNLAFQDVHRFFWRQKAQLKKSNKSLPKGTYDLPVGTPPVICLKIEENFPSFKPRSRTTKIKVEQTTYFTDSDTLYAPTSDTFVGTPDATKKSLLHISKDSSPLPPSSPPPPSSPASERGVITGLIFSPYRSNRASLLPVTSELEWCCAGGPGPSVSSFTCALCTRAPEEQFENSTDSFVALTIQSDVAFPSDALNMELSALPFIYRSPDLLDHQDSIPDSTQWFFDLIKSYDQVA